MQYSQHSKKQTGPRVSKALQQARYQLKHSSDAPGLDAEWLLLDVLGRSETSWLYAHGDKEMSKDEKNEYQKLIERRKTGEPLAYLLGYWEFYGRRFVVNKNVLVPRPSTEELIDAILPKLKKGMVVADIGTGSGCIAVTIALEAKTPLRIIATDVSPAALKVAKKNAEVHGVADKIEFIQGDMLEALENRRVDFIVSNPPYLPIEEVLPFEPALALDGGMDGQKFIRQIKASGIPAVVEGTGGRIQVFAAFRLCSSR